MLNSTSPQCYSLSLVTPPTSEPVTLEEAKEHVRQSGDDQDATIKRLIIAARTHCEGRLSQAFVTQTWDLQLDRFPLWAMRLPKAPLQSITSAKYIDVDGVEQTISASDYLVTGATTPPSTGEAKTPPTVGWIEPAYGKVWPTPRCETGAVRIRLVAGYGLAAVVPACIKEAMLMLLGHWYENREAVNVGNMVTPLPLAVDALLMTAWHGSY